MIFFRFASTIERNRSVLAMAAAADVDMSQLRENQAVRDGGEAVVGKVTEIITTGPRVTLDLAITDGTIWKDISENLYVGVFVDRGGIHITDSPNAAKSLGHDQLKKLSVCDFERYEITPLQKRRHDLLQKEVVVLEQGIAAQERINADLNKTAHQIEGSLNHIDGTLKEIQAGLDRVAESDRNNFGRALQFEASKGERK